MIENQASEPIAYAITVTAVNGFRRRLFFCVPEGIDASSAMTSVAGAAERLSGTGIGLEALCLQVQAVAEEFGLERAVH